MTVERFIVLFFFVAAVAAGCVNYQFGDYTRAAIERCKALEATPGQCREDALHAAYFGLRVVAKMTGASLAPVDAVITARRLLAEYRASRIALAREDVTALTALSDLTAAEQKSL